jgi:hypothetical protein
MAQICPRRPSWRSLLVGLPLLDAQYLTLLLSAVQT